MVDAADHDKIEVRKNVTVIESQLIDIKLFLIVNRHKYSKSTIPFQASRNELHNLLEKPQLAGIPILVLGNKRDLPNALDENGLIERMNLNAVQDREICCYSVSCKEKDNIDITLQWLISHSKSGGSGGGGPPGTSASVRNGQ